MAGEGGFSRGRRRRPARADDPRGREGAVRTRLRPRATAPTTGSTRAWTLRQAPQYLGWHSGGGLGYGVGAAIGAALANGPGTISVDVQADGDLLFQPQALWTAAHLSLPVLIVVFDNRQYGNTVEHAANIARSRGRGDERRYRGAGLAVPATDLATLARSFGIWSAGPIADAGTLADRLAEAVDVAASGKPALLDVLTPGF